MEEIEREFEGKLNLVKAEIEKENKKNG